MENYVVRQDSYKTSALNFGPEKLMTLAPSLWLVEGGISILVMAPPAPNLCPYYSDLTSPHLLMPTPALACLAPSALAPQHSTSTLLNNIDFRQGIKDALPYADMSQTHYPSPHPPPVAALSVDNLVLLAKSTANEIHHAPSLLAIISLWQLGIL